MKRDWIPIPKDLSDKWDARNTETARKNPDWIPELYETEVHCACVDANGKPSKSFNSHSNALEVCAWLNKFHPNDPPQIPYLCPHTEFWHLKDMN